jgi:hypothetical protein
MNAIVGKQVFRVLGCLIVLGGVLVAPALRGQGPDKQPAGAAMSSPDAELKKLTAQLNLRGDQVAKARKILAEREKHVIEVRNQYPAPKPGAAPAAGGPEKMHEVYKTAHAQMAAILDDNQKKKYDALDAAAQGPQGKQ